MKNLKYMAPAIKIKEMSSESFIASSVTAVSGDADITRYNNPSGTIPSTADGKGTYSVWNDNGVWE